MESHLGAEMPSPYTNQAESTCIYNTLIQAAFFLSDGL